MAQSRRQNKRLGIYVHIPFCRKKCAYCDFYSYCPHDARVYEAYADAVIAHMKSYRDVGVDYAPDTVYIGGGTPTSMPPEEMLRILHGIRSSFRVVKNAEITMECNPATADMQTLRRYRRVGVNRLSIGMQSSNENELRALGRIHSFGDVKRTVRDAREARIDNINLDLMYGIPFQTFDSWRDTLRRAVALRPEHISLYCLKLEAGTPMCENASRYVFPDDEMQFAMYSHAISYLASCGYEQYEISNFARRGFECRHNLKYWQCEEYLGFGPSAHSYFANVRFSFKPSVSEYIKNVVGGARGALTDEYEQIPARERLGEYVMLRMRLNAGIDRAEFFRTFGKDFDRLFGQKLARYVKGGFVKDTGGAYRFTTSGMFVSNYILSDILDFDADGHFLL